MFSVVSGGGSVTGATATTNASGIATVGSWSLGTTAGANTLTATVTGLPAVTFTATGTAGAAASVAISSGNTQTATAGAAVATAPAVVVRDANSNPVPGVSVAFAVATGGGSVTGATATTNASGIAAVDSWTLGATAGANTLTATVTGLPAVTFTATGTANAPGSVASVQMAATASSILVGDVAYFEVTVRDAVGNLLGGRATNWTTSNAIVAQGIQDGYVAVVGGLSAGTVTITANVEGISAQRSLTVIAPATNICTQIAGLLVFANDGTYLGRLTNRFDSQSVNNTFGTYGSTFSSTSIFNTVGTYGSQFGAQSPWNRFSSTPPILYDPFSFLPIAYLTVNTALSPRVTPQVLRNCSFP